MSSTILGIDIGSSSVIAGILSEGRTIMESPRAFFRSICSGPKVEVDPDALLAAVATAISSLGNAALEVDHINIATMSPAWLAMDGRGTPLTPIVTHQDRRSVAEAVELRDRIGAERHLELAGNLPFPGGISSTTWSWFLKKEPGRLKNAATVGHLNTYLQLHLTGARVTDPSNASFTGLYETITLDGWNEELADNLGIISDLLPDVVTADTIVGGVRFDAAKRFHLREGTPVLVGIMDGSAGMILAGADVGRLFNVVGSTDVLALCTESPRPHPELLTRALGVGRKWLQVSTLAAAASSVYWARDQFFSGMPIQEFQSLVHDLAARGPSAAGGVTFSPYMAGSRTSIVQPRGGFDGVTLGTTREHLLSAIIEGLIAASAGRLPLLRATGTAILPNVAVSGGGDRLDKVMQRDWPKDWTYEAVTDATMRGLAKIRPEHELVVDTPAV